MRLQILTQKKWLEDRIDDRVLDPEALQDMPLRDVKAQLRKLAGPSSAFYEALNARLPEEYAIAEPVPPKRNRTHKAAPEQRAPERGPAKRRRSRTRFIGLRGALITSAFIIIAAIAVPLVIQRLNSGALPETVDETELPATNRIEPNAWIEGPDPAQLIRNVKYRISGLLAGQNEVLYDPLPENPDSLITSIRLRLVINGAGEVVHIEAQDKQPHVLEKPLVDSLSQWRFEAIEDETVRTEAEITVSFFVE